MSDLIPIKSFCADTFAPYCSVNVIYKDDKKHYAPEADWLTWDASQSKIRDPKDNALLINIRKRFIVLDADTPEAGEKIIQLLTKYKIYNEEYQKNYITTSISNVLQGKKYKLHFWLKKKGHEIKKITNCYNCGLDLITDYICEPINNKISYNYTAMPNCPDDLINELQANTPSAIKARETEIKQIEEDNKNLDFDELKINEIVNMLDVTKSEDYQQWNLTGLILAGLSNDYFYIWNDFSKQCVKKYPGEDKLFKIWKTFKGPEQQPQGGAGIGTLMYWAKQDNPTAYNEFINKYFNKEINKLFHLYENLNNKDVADYYYQNFPNKYIFGGDVKNKKSGWFGFRPNNQIINYGAVPTGLLNHLSDFMQKESYKLTNNLDIKYNQIKNDKNMDKETKKDEIEIIRKKKELIKNAYNKLGSSCFISGCICFLADYYYNDKIDELIDSNIKLLAFKNGVYDFEKNIFRPIETTDYISKCTNYDYNPIINNPIRQQINNLLLDTFGDESVKNYFLGVHGVTLFSTCLESIFLLNGKGGNGKGLITSIIQGALGDYFQTAENTFLTSQIKAGAPNPTLANAKGARYLSISEPEDVAIESTFNMGLIKTLTGKDKISTRALYKDNIVYLPQFTPFIQCNDIPKLNKVDNAVKRRFKIINFPFQFVDNPTKPNEKQNNSNLKELINKEYYNEFILMLIENANKYKNNKLEIPASVATHTNNYFEDNNILLNWFNEKIEQTGDNKDYVKTSELFDDFKRTTGENIDNKLFMKNLKTFDLNIVAVKGCKAVRGIKLINNDDEEDEANPLDV